MWVREITVKGAGTFPFDMLRYDGAYPRTESDAGLLYPHEKEMREVTLIVTGSTKHMCTPEARRWESFNWRVTSMGEPRKV